MRVIAVWSIKGGVGKTTAAVNLAALAAREGARALLWDLDPQGGASFLLRVSPRRKASPRRLARRSVELRRMVRATDVPNLDLLPSDLTYRTLELELNARKSPSRRLAVKLTPLDGHYDWVVLDCAPSVTLVSEAVLHAADDLLVPVIPSALSLRTLEQTRRFIAQTRSKAVRVLPFLSMVDRRRRLHREGCERFAGGAEGFLRTIVPMSSIVERAAEARLPLFAVAPSSRATRAFASLWQEVREQSASPTD
ncbi:MAG: ParA family protein [Acidobacteria bacterium]|jgi:chromosome partitioning protein|nr:ParA family protein [Acidobacteriota bacterium]